MPEAPDHAANFGSSPQRGGILFAAALIVAAVVAVYANSLRAPFVFDDIPGIVENATIRNLGDLRTVLAAPSDIGSSANSRPLLNLSLALNFAAGGLNPAGYHAANMALHALAALALFGLVRRTCLLPPMRPRLGAVAMPVAFSSALLWAVHPLQTETVTCVIQRTEGLVGFFYLFACYGFVRSIEAAESGRFRWEVVTVATCLLGAVSKEVMVTAPAILLLYDRTFVAGTFAGALKRRWAYHLSLFASWIPLAWLVLNSGGRGGTVGFGKGVGFVENILTQCMAVILYLKLSFWPHPLVMDYGSDVVSGFAAVWPQALLLAFLLAATIWALRRRPVLGFVGAWFFVILSPSSSVVPLQTQTLAEHRMYLPLAGVLVPLVAWLWIGLGRRAAFVTAFLAVACGTATIARNNDYRSAISIWEDTYGKQPENPRAATNLFLELMTQGRTEESLRLGETVVATHGDNSELRVDYGTVLFHAGRIPEAAAQYETAVRLDPKNAEAHFNLGNLDAQAGRFPEARAQYEAAVRYKPAHVPARLNLGHVLTTLGLLPEALAQFREAQRLAPENAETNFSLGNALAELGQLEDAVVAYERTLGLAPGHPGATANLAQARAILLQRGGATPRGAP